MKQKENKHDDHKDVQCRDEKKNEKKCECDGKKGVECCNCVEEMAKQLKKFKGQQVIVFEKDAFAVGTVKKVKGKAVLVLEDAFKLAILGDNVFVIIIVEDLFISICEITEFAPLGPGGAQTILDNLKKTNAIQVL